MIDLKQVLIGEPTRLRYVKRFSICPKVHEESVAEHSYYVAFICLMLGEDLMNQGFVKLNLGMLLSRALIHDLDEVFSGDFIRMFKHQNIIVEEAINATSKILVERFTQNYPAGKKLLDYWENSKSEDLEGSILAFADFLSVLSYIWQEIHAGNHIMFTQLDELEKFCGLFSSTKFEPLWEYQMEAQFMLKELRRIECKTK